MTIFPFSTRKPHKAYRSLKIQVPTPKKSGYFQLPGQMKFSKTFTNPSMQIPPFNLFQNEQIRKLYSLFLEYLSKAQISVCVREASMGFRPTRPPGVPRKIHGQTRSRTTECSTTNPKRGLTRQRQAADPQSLLLGAQRQQRLLSDIMFRRAQVVAVKSAKIPTCAFSVLLALNCRCHNATMNVGNEANAGNFGMLII